MANPTTNYGFVLPEPTDLVTDLPADFDVALQGVDTRLKALQPGTTEGDLVYASSTANTNLRLGIGTTGQNLTVVAGVPAWATASTLSYAIFTDQKTTGSHGGTFTSGAFRTRDLQTTRINNITGCSLASNQITLATGTYYVDATCPGISINQHAPRLFNITDSSVTILGSSEYTDQAQSVTTRGVIQGIFTITATKVFEIQGQCGSTKATTGFGQATNIQTETYTIVNITKI